MIDMQSESEVVDDYGFPIQPACREFYSKWHKNYQLIVDRRSSRWDATFPAATFMNGSVVEKNRALQRFVQKGVPPHRRIEVWMFISGASKLSSENPGLYETLSSDEAPPLPTATEHQITCDLQRTFPENALFQSIAIDSLRRVLSAAARYLEDIGYCQGMNLIAGLFLLVFARATKLQKERSIASKKAGVKENALEIDANCEKNSFFMLIIFVRDILKDYFSQKMAGLLLDLSVLSALIEARDVQLARFLRNQSLPLGAVTSRWMVTAFANCLPSETTLRIWDGLFYDGVKVLFGAVLQLINIHRSEILSARDPSAAVLALNSMIDMSPATLSCHEFAAGMFSLGPPALNNSGLAKVVGRRSKSHVTNHAIKQLRASLATRGNAALA